MQIWSDFKHIWLIIAIIYLAGCSNAASTATKGGNKPDPIYFVYVQVNGLRASLELLLNDSETLTIDGPGQHRFNSEFSGSEEYSVTISRQPTSPNQICSLNNNGGTFANEHVTSIVIDCTTVQYQVGGMIEGLLGSGLQLQLNDQAPFNIDQSGSFPFIFPQPIDDGTDISVTVVTQPTALSQTCSAIIPTPTVNSADMTDLTITCTTNLFRLKTHVSGLIGGGLSVQLNNLEPEIITGNGAKVLATQLADGTPYSLTFVSLPNNPAQQCSIDKPSGNISANQDLPVNIVCAVQSFKVSGNVSNLLGSNMKMQINTGETVDVDLQGNFAFTQAVADGTDIFISVAQQPTALSQNCIVANPSHKISGVDINDINVNCTTNKFRVGGSVSGLLDNTNLVLTLNNSITLPVTSNGAFVFNVDLLDGSNFNAVITTQPTNPKQNCAISGNSNKLEGAHYNAISVTCNPVLYTLSGAVSGLLGSGLELILNGSETLPVNGSTFIFTGKLRDLESFDITIGSQPVNPAQNCNITNHQSGTVAAANISDIQVTCTTKSFSIGGSISNLNGSGLRLRLLTNSTNIEELDIIKGQSTFSFVTKLQDLSGFNIEIVSNPSNLSQNCNFITIPNNKLNGNDITDVSINCVTQSFSINVNVLGLQGSGMQVQLQQNNTVIETKVISPTDKIFDAQLQDGSDFTVSILTQPTQPIQNCGPASVNTTISGSNASVTFNCATEAFTIGGAITGLQGTGLKLRLLSNNVTIEDLPIAGGTFQFITPLADQSTFNIVVATQPVNPSQNCDAITIPDNQINGTNISNISVTCSTNTFTVGGVINNLQGSGLALQLMQGQNVLESIPNAQPTYVFQTALADNSEYTVNVTSDPVSPKQTCTPKSITATIQGANTSDSISCVTDQFLVGGTINNLQGDGLMIRLKSNGQTVDEIPLAKSSTGFQFNNPLDDLSSFSIDIVNQPINFAQTCNDITIPTNTINGADVNNVAITCSLVKFPINVTVTNLSGSGLVLQLLDESQIIETKNDAPADFTFSSGIPDGHDFSVSILSHPVSPNQDCSPTTSGGTINGAGTLVSLTCTTKQYTISGNINNLAGSGLRLQLIADSNVVETLDVNNDATDFIFNTPVNDLSVINVLAVQQPSSLSQNCNNIQIPVSTVNGAPINNISVNCVTNKFAVSGIVSNLQGSQMDLELFHNSTLVKTLLNVSENFTFGNEIADGESFTVKIARQPQQPAQDCAPLTITRTINGGPVNDLQFGCTTLSFFVGGTVTGLNGSIELLNNNADLLVLNATGADTSFQFSQPLPDGSAYNVSLLQSPLLQNCSINSGDGALNGNNVISVIVNCNDKTWTSPQQLNSVNNVASKPTVSMNTTGDAVVVFEQHDDSLDCQNDSGLPSSCSRIYNSEYSASMQAWTTPQPISASGAHAFDPKLSLNDSGDYVVVWEQKHPQFMCDGDNGSTNCLQVFIYEKFSNTVKPAISSTAVGQNIQAFDPDVRISNNEAGLITWTQSGGPATCDGSACSQVFAAFRMNNNWLALSTSLSLSNLPAYSPDIDMDASGNAVVVWEQEDGRTNCGGGTSCLLVYSSDFVGAQNIFLQPMQRSLNGLDLNGDQQIETFVSSYKPKVNKSANGRAIITWEQEDGTTGCGGTGCLIAHYVLRDTNGNWGQTTPAHSATNDAFSPDAIIHNDGRFSVAWENINSDSRIRVITFNSAQQIISDDILSDAGSNAFNIALFHDANGNALITWTQDVNCAPNCTLAGFMMRYRNNAWTSVTNPLQPFTNPNFDIENIPIAASMSNNGNAIMVWERFETAVFTSLYK